MRIVIIGNGVAGIEAALAVRATEPSWTVTVISEESDHFFSRTALMWVLCGQLSHRCIEPYERDLYERMDLRRVRARAVGLDTDGRRVLLAGGLDPVPYDRLLIACGSAPRPAPWTGADLAGVGHFVTMQDLEWLEAEVHGGPSRAGRPPRPDAHLAATAEGSPYATRPVARRGAHERAAVIGGGLIGIEAVEVLLAAGLRPTFFIREETFWPIALDHRESGWIADRMREHGVDVRLDESVEALVGDERLEAIRTDRGDQPCDLCVVAIGVVPNTDWLRAGGEPAVRLDERGGIAVDAGLRTSAEDVLASGDCASVRWFDGASRPEQLWYTARAQGRVAGRRLLGEDAEYARGTWYNSAKLMDIEYTTAGLVNMGVPHERNWFFEERGAVRSTTRIVTSNDRVVGFNLLGRRWDHAVLCRWIEERRTLDEVLDRLDEARFDTEFVSPLVIGEAAREAGLEGPAPRADELPSEVAF